MRVEEVRGSSSTPAWAPMGELKRFMGVQSDSA
jgi:hypothetical protein